ncbi:4Fe-4S binding protein [bacterium]|nr:4Fe-4S binding protein [bacterium]
MNYQKRILIILLLLLVTVSLLVSIEVKQHCGKHFPKSEQTQTTETISGILQITDNQLQLVQDSTLTIHNLIIPENMEKDMDKIEIGKKYNFFGKSSKSGFVVEKYSLCQETKNCGSHEVNSEKCIGCRLCLTQCPEGAISMVNGKAVIDQEKCIDCGICISGNGRFKGCPVKAIEKK